MQKFTSVDDFMDSFISAAIKNANEGGDFLAGVGMIAKSFLHANTHFLEDTTFAQALRQWAADKILNQRNEQLERFVVAHVSLLGDIIQSFPGGDPENKYRIFATSIEITIDFSRRYNESAKLLQLLENELKDAQRRVFWRQILKIDSADSAYLLLQANVQLLDDTFAPWLKRHITVNAPTYIVAHISRPEMFGLFGIALSLCLYPIETFGVTLQNFPQGNKENNQEIAIATFEGILQIQTETSSAALRNFPQRDKENNQEIVATLVNKFMLQIQTADIWAKFQAQLGVFYLVRIKGSRTKNLDKAIDCLESALKVFDPKGSKEDWMYAKNALGKAYLERSKMEN